MIHIFDRFVIHFVSAAFLVMAAWFLLRLWTRKNLKVTKWLSPGENHLLVTAGLVVFAVATLREPIDVYLGQSVAKAVSDQLSWFSGAAIAVWGLYRFSQRRG